MKLPIPSQHNDDFFTDRLCRRYGPLVFIAAAIMIAGALANPCAFSCWVPASFTLSHKTYASDICWNKGKLYQSSVDFDPAKHRRALDEDTHDIDVKKLRYFPVVLILQIVVFFLPHIFWRSVNVVMGFNMDRIVKAAAFAVEPGANVSASSNPDHILSKSEKAPDNTTSETTNRGCRTIAAHVISVLKAPFPFLGGRCSGCGGQGLVIAYFLTKLGYLMAAFAQMAILGMFLDINFFTLRFGDSLWDDIVSGQSEGTKDEIHHKTRNIFPEDALCDFTIRRMGERERYTIQCTLNFNLTIERVVVCLWLWLWFTILLLSISTVIWFIRIAYYFSAPQRYKSKRVSLLLGQIEGATPATDKLLDEFSRFLLKPDGALILEILEDNVSLVAAAEVVKAAWMQFQQERMRNERQGQTSQGDTCKCHISQGRTFQTQESQGNVYQCHVPQEHKENIPQGNNMSQYGCQCQCVENKEITPCCMGQNGFSTPSTEVFTGHSLYPHLGGGVQPLQPSAGVFLGGRQAPWAP